MNKFDMRLEQPLMNAAGILGFSPEPHGPVDLSLFGAFITHPVSLSKRTPAHGVRWAATASGFLLHTGYPNPGLSAVLRQYASRWRHSPLPVVVHLLAGTPAETARMAARLENMENVLAVEVGLPTDIPAQMAVAIATACKAEIPIIMRLPLERATALATVLVNAVNQGSCAISAISLGPPRGALPWPQGRAVSGRLYGPAIFPLALSAVRTLAALGLPVIGAGGVYTPEQVDAMLEGGATAVQLDSVLWRGYP